MASSSQTPSLATPSSTQQDNENWCRIALLVWDAILPAIISVIHNDCNDPAYQGFPRNDADLYNELDARRSNINQMKKKKLITQHQYDILLPSSGKTDSSAFDITLAYAVIRNLFKFKTSTGWNYKTLENQKSMEVSIPAYVLRGKELRNFLCHSNPALVDQKTLDDKWREGADVVNGLKYNCDLNSLRNRPLDAKTFESLKDRFDVESKVLRDDLALLKDKIDDLQINDELKIKRMDEMDGRQHLMDESLTTVIKEVNSLKKAETFLDDSASNRHSGLNPGTKAMSDQAIFIAWRSADIYFYAVDTSQEFEEVTKEELYEFHRDTNQWNLIPYRDGIKMKVVRIDRGKTRVSMLKGMKLKEQTPPVYKIVVEMKKKDTNEKIYLELKTNEIKEYLVFEKGALKVRAYGTSATRKMFFEKFENNEEDEVSEEIVLNCGESERISRDFQWCKFIFQKGFDFLSVDECEDKKSPNQISKTELQQIAEETEVENMDTDDPDYEAFFSSNSDCESSSGSFYGLRNGSSIEEGSIDRTKWEKQLSQNWKRCYTLRSHVVGSQCENESVQRLVSFISEKYCNQGVFIFPGYCVKRHDAFIRGRPFEDRIEEDCKNILVFIPVHRLILLIKAVESYEVNLFDIYRELEAHNDEIKLFLRRHSCHFIDDEHSLYPILLLPHAGFNEYPKMLDRNSLGSHFPFCEKLRKRIFYQEDLSDVDVISQKWEQLTQNIRQRSLDRASERCRNGWKKFLSHVIGYLSTTNFLLPGPREDLSIVVKKMFLSHRQHHALLDDKNHTLITGSYGTGKSIMCQLKLIRLVRTLDENHTIHFISFNERSLLTRYLENVVQHLRNCVEKDRGSNYPKIVIKNLASDRLAEYLRDAYSNQKMDHTHHFIGDEFNPAFLTVAEVKKLNSVLSLLNNNHFTVSLSVIPLTKRRQRKRPNCKAVEVINDGYRLGQLDMKEWKLDKVFRVTKEVHELMKAAVEVVESNPTRFTIRESENHQETEGPVISVADAASFSIEDDGVFNSSSNCEMDRTSSLIHTDNQTDRDMDFLFKLQSQDDSDQGVMYETAFFFEKCEIDAHRRAIGQKPNLITLIEDSELRFQALCDQSLVKQLVFNLYVALIKTVRIEDLDQSTVIICTSWREVAVCKAALEIAKRRDNCDYHIYLPTLYPSMNTPGNCRNGILLVDFDGVTGLEFRNVVIPVTESEHFMAFKLVQSLTRSLGQVHFVRFPSENNNLWRTPVIGQVIASWRKKNLIKEIFLKQCQPCKSNEDNLCSCGEEDKDEDSAIIFACQRSFNEIEPTYIHPDRLWRTTARSGKLLDTMIRGCTFQPASTSTDCT